MYIGAGNDFEAQAYTPIIFITIFFDGHDCPCTPFEDAEGIPPVCVWGGDKINPLGTYRDVNIVMEPVILKQFLH